MIRRLVLGLLAVGSFCNAAAFVVEFFHPGSVFNFVFHGSSAAILAYIFIQESRGIDTLLD